MAITGRSQGFGKNLSRKSLRGRAVDEEGKREQRLYKGIHCSLDISAWAGSLSVPRLVLEGASPCLSLCLHVPPFAVAPI